MGSWGRSGVEDKEASSCCFHTLERIKGLKGSKRPGRGVEVEVETGKQKQLGLEDGRQTVPDSLVAASNDKPWPVLYVSTMQPWTHAPGLRWIPIYVPRRLHTILGPGPKLQARLGRTPSTGRLTGPSSCKAGRPQRGGQQGGMGGTMGGREEKSQPMWEHEPGEGGD